jgi:predicted MPP superfamily phosphohydrolase
MRPGILLVPFFLLMILAPIIVRLTENAGLDLFARIMAYSGYFWMVIIFLFFSASLVTDFYRLIIYLGNTILSLDLKALTLSPKTSFLIPLVISLGISLYGYFEALNIQTEYITIETEKLPPGLDRIRIAQVSDVHIGLIVRSDRLERILQKVKESDPDIFVSTGDLVDGQINGLEGLADLFRSINPRLGKFAVTGNHEYIAGIKEAIAFTNKAGFKLLRDEGINVDNAVTLVGVDDPGSMSSGVNNKTDEKAILSSFPRERFIVLLKHRPLIDPGSVGLFDLQLSGHVHKGQIFPFSIITHFYYKHQAGLLRFDGGILYISRGTGTWGPPIRFLAPPEVTVIDIVRKK